MEVSGMTKQHDVVLSADDRVRLGTLIERRATAGHTRRRARILLAADSGQWGPRLTDREAAAVSRSDVRTVARTRVEYCTEGLEAAITRRRRSDRRPTRLDGAGQARLTALACSPPPPGRACWTIRLLAARLVELEVIPSIAPETVRLALKKTASARGSSSAGVSHRERMRPL